MTHANQSRAVRLWPLIALVSVVFVVPVLILVFTIGLIDDSISVVVRNESRATLREVRVVVNGRIFDLGTIAPGALSPVDERFPAPVTLQASAKMDASAFVTQSERFFCDPLMGVSLECVLDDEKQWTLLRN